MTSLYISALSNEEKEVWDDLKINTLEDEIKLLKIQLARVLREQQLVEPVKNDPRSQVGFFIAEMEEETNLNSAGAGQQQDGSTPRRGSVRRKIKRERRDHLDAIAKLASRIAALTAIHHNVSGPPPQSPAEIMAEALKAMAALDNSTVGPPQSEPKGGGDD